MAVQPAGHGTETKLCPELIREVYRALNFDPVEFAKRHAEEFVRRYLRADGMLSHAGDGEEIVSYLATRVNECLSKADYALLSFIDYAGREAKDEDSDSFCEAVAQYLQAREQVGPDWSYAFEAEEARTRCLAVYPQMHAIARAMYNFALEIDAFKEVAWTDSPNAWPNPKKLQKSMSHPPA